MNTKGLAAALALATAVLAGAPEPAEAQKVPRSRLEIDDVGGNFIQPEPVWVPVQAKGRGRPIYLGLLLRLHPHSERRFEACVLTPHVTDWIVIDFNQKPPTRAEFDDTAKMRKRVEDLVIAKAGRGVFRQIEVMEESTAVDEVNAELTLMCK